MCLHPTVPILKANSGNVAFKVEYNIHNLTFLGKIFRVVSGIVTELEHRARAHRDNRRSWPYCTSGHSLLYNENASCRRRNGILTFLRQHAKLIQSNWSR